MRRFDLFAAMNGVPIATEGGTRMQFVAHLPQAKMSSRLVMLSPDGEVITYWDDGVFHSNRTPSCMDVSTVTSREKESHS